MSDDLGPYLHEFFTNSIKLHDAAEEAAKLYAQGDPLGACREVALSHYVLDSLTDERANLLDLFAKQGVRPEG